MKYCPICKQANPDCAIFCSECGVSLPQNATPQNTAPQNTAIPNAKPFNYNIAWAAAAICGILLCVIAILLN